MALHTLSVFSDGSVKRESSTPASEFIRYRVLTECESSLWGNAHEMDTPAPQVFPTSATPEAWPDTNRCRFTEPKQRFWVDLFSLAKYGKLFADLPRRGSPAQNVEINLIVSAFKDVTRGDKAMFDAHGTEEYNNYITGEMHPLGFDPLQESKIQGNAFVYSKKSWATGWNRKKGKMIRILSILDYEPLPVPSLQHKCVQLANIIYKNCTMGPFPQLKGVDMPVPFITKGEAWYPEAGLVEA